MTRGFFPFKFAVISMGATLLARPIVTTTSIASRRTVEMLSKFRSTLVGDRFEEGSGAARYFCPVLVARISP
jgi:hypothetical protein